MQIEKSKNIITVPLVMFETNKFEEKAKRYNIQLNKSIYFETSAGGEKVQMVDIEIEYDCEDFQYINFLLELLSD